MRRIFQLSALCIAAGVVNACKPDEIVETENIPTAGVRFINAVPDTGAMDFRFVDIVESNAQYNVAFRNQPVTTAGVTASTLVQYKNARATTGRHFKIFMNGNTIAIASKLVKDTTVDLVAGHNYTALMMGSARDEAATPKGPNPMRLVFIDETVADASPNVSLRVINASFQTVTVSYYATSTTPAGTPPGTTIAAALAPLTVSPYVTTAPATLRYYIVSGGVVIGDAQAIVGTAATTAPPGPFDAVPGTSIAGTAVTAIIFPQAVAGSQAPAFAITTGAATVNSATPTGYARQAGSFVADGFFVGQQITVSGFTNAANNGTSTITAIGESNTTGSISMSATATGYARVASTGSFVTNGFTVGQTVTASGFTTPQNNGRSVITAVTATALTVTKTGGTVAEAAATGRTVIADGTLTVTKAGGTVNEAGTTGNVIHLSATATGFQRSAGSFVTDGFTVGQRVTSAGYLNTVNNGTSTITAVTATDLTVTKTGGTAVEAGSTGATALSATTTGYARAAGSFVTDGFLVGHRVNASGFIDSANNGASTVTAVTAGALTVTKTPQTVAEVAAVGRTITVIDLRSISNGDNRTIAGVVGRLWSFVWDRRPPRPPGV